MNTENKNMHLNLVKKNKFNQIRKLNISNIDQHGLASYATDKAEMLSGRFSPVNKY